MNKSKKTLKAQPVHKKTIKEVDRKIWLIPAIILSIVLIVALTFDQLYERVLLNINGTKYHLDDLRYYFYNVESRYDYIDQLYGGGYWDMKYDQTSNYTVAEVAAQEAMSTAIYNEIMYKEAVAAGYTLTAEETDQVNSDISSLLYDQGYSEKMLTENGFNADYLTKVMDKMALAKRYRKDIVDTLPVDDAKIESGISKEENRQYDVEYLFLSKMTKNDAGESVAMTEADETAAYEKMKGVYDKALTTEDWSTLVPEGEEQLQYTESNFLPGDTGLDVNLKAMMMKMNNGDISDVFDAENGYYIVKMVNNNSDEGYKKAVDKAITAAEDEAFQSYYGENILSKYDVKINTKAVKALHMGTVTLID